MRGSVGRQAAPAARRRNLRRGSFMASSQDFTSHCTTDVDRLLAQSAELPATAELASIVNRFTCPSAQPRSCSNDVFESGECLGLANNNQANCIGLRTFLLRKRFAIASALVLQMVSIKWNLSLLGKASHRNLVDDRWQMVCPLSPNHPAQVFKK